MFGKTSIQSIAVISEGARVLLLQNSNMHERVCPVTCPNIVIRHFLLRNGKVKNPIVVISPAFCSFLDQPFKPFLSKFGTQDEGEQVLDSLYEFRTPRNAILVIASEFINTSKKRLQEMNGKNTAQMPNLALDHESIQVAN